MGGVGSVERKTSAQALFGEILRLGEIGDSVTMMACTISDAVLGQPPPTDKTEASITSSGEGVLGQATMRIRRTVEQLHYANKRLEELARELNTGEPQPAAPGRR